MEEPRIMFTIGNLYTGDPYVVVAERNFGTTDIYGPFATENQANTACHVIVQDMPTEYVAVTVSRVSFEQAGRKIVRRKDGAYEYASA